MELRKENEAPEIRLESTDIRRTGAAIRQGRRAAGAGAGGVARAAGAARNAVKYVALDRQQKKALDYLSGEQMKQWKSYSRREQKRILASAARTAEKWERTGMVQGGWNNAEAAADTILPEQETGMPDITAQRQKMPVAAKAEKTPVRNRAERNERFRMVRVKTGYPDALREGRRKPPVIVKAELTAAMRQTEGQAVFLMPHGRVVRRAVTGAEGQKIPVSIKAERTFIRSRTEENGRFRSVYAETGHQDIFRERRRKPPVIVKAELTMARKKKDGQTVYFLPRGRAGRRAAAAEEGQKVSSGKYPGFALYRKMDALPRGRHIVKGVHGGDVVFYEPRRDRAVKKADRIMRDQRKAAKREAGKEKVFWRTFTSMLDRDIRRKEQMDQVHRRERMELAEHEAETHRRVSRTVFFLPRAAAEMFRQKLIIALQKAAAGMLKFLAPALVPLLLVIILVAVMGCLLGGISGSNGYSAAGQEIVAYAEQFIGVTKYVWGAGRGGGDDWQDYADCSSFVHGVFAHFGYEIGGVTYDMINSGTLVSSIEEAVPGDIILFIDGSSPEHVGLYAGDNRMIHCAGGPENYSPATAGTGVCWGNPYSDGRPFQVRRIVQDVVYGEGGHRKDRTNYTQAQKELIWAIVAQEDNGSYEGALAVISSAMNRTDSPSWSFCGSNALEQLTAPGQYCYSIDNYWRARLNGNVPDYVKRAVSDCLDGGVRNHPYTCFRSTKGSATGPDAVQIGGNWFFGN